MLTIFPSVRRRAVLVSRPCRGAGTLGLLLWRELWRPSAGGGRHVRADQVGAINASKPCEPCASV